LIEHCPVPHPCAFFLAHGWETTNPNPAPFFHTQYNKPVTKLSPPASPTVGFISLGCPKNLVDSEVTIDLLDRAANLEFILEAAPCR